jgi:hypothetical protein
MHHAGWATAGVFVCVTTNQKAAKHTHAKNKLQKLALSWLMAAKHPLLLRPNEK